MLCTDVLALREQIRLAGLQSGLVRVGFASVESPLAREQFFQKWLANGMSANMDFLRRTGETRARPSQLLPNAKTAIVGLASYAATEKENNGRVLMHQGIIARYARGKDYHFVLRERLQRLALKIEQLLRKSFIYMIAVDSAPIMERELAMAAGVGFIGKNTMLITPGIGSYTVIGTLLTDLDLPPDEPSLPRCGQCQRCLVSCPTGALVQPYTLDSRLCLSYYSIEHRGIIPLAIRAKMSPWLFGCDSCQQVCPYNQNVGATIEPDVDLAPSQSPLWWDLLDTLNLRSSSYKRLTAGRALRRATRQMLIRNAAMVTAALSAEQCSPPLKEALHRLAQSADQTVQEAARWALQQIDNL